jgi:hypothetical protein
MGMPDKVIAFDELPEDLLKGIEMFDCSALPRYWREYIGIREKHIKLMPDIDPITRQRVTYPELVEKAPYAFMIDWEINKDKERWQEICNYVRRNAPKDFRLMDKIEDMAKPMAVDAHSELNLEPEDVIVIPLGGAVVENDPTLPTTEIVPKEMFKCADCEKEFDEKRGLRMHRMKKHKEVVPV